MDSYAIIFAAVIRAYDHLPSHVYPEELVNEILSTSVRPNVSKPLLDLFNALEESIP